MSQEVRRSNARGGRWLTSMGFEHPHSCFRRLLAPQDGAVDPCGLSWTPRYKRESVRHTFLFWLVARLLDIAQLTVMENVRSAKAPRVSVARTTNENVPRVVGVPVIRPGLAESCKPGGSWPERSVQV